MIQGATGLPVAGKGDGAGWIGTGATQASPPHIHTSPAPTRRSRFSARFTKYLDRKSTRLNSSHTVISYAVFCLKKKKEKNLRDDKDTRELISRATSSMPAT